MMLTKIRNYLSLFRIKKDKAIDTCIKNNIPLTNENIAEIRQLLKHNRIIN
jgi:hypothetical protein